MEKRVKFTMSATDFIKSVGTVRQSGEKLFYRIPFWFESTDDPNVFIQHDDYPIDTAFIEKLKVFYTFKVVETAKDAVFTCYFEDKNTGMGKYLNFSHDVPTEEQCWNVFAKNVI